VIVRGNERKAIFRDDVDCREYLDRLGRCRDRFGFSLYAFCLMSNHVHLAIEEGDVLLSKIMHVLQSSYTQWFNRRHRRVGHLFQGRFKSYVVDSERYLLSLIRYIHENPVRAGMAERPEDYPWSSDRYFRTGHGPDRLDLDRILAMLAPTRPAAVSRYRELMGKAPDHAYESLSAVQGTVKGDEAFAARFVKGV
jgi:REP element-mobilizing transposase RayT